MRKKTSSKARRSRRIPVAIKQSLFSEAGEKCANPGCSNWRAHYHHIRHWAVYATHDAAHMIAICPTCHDAVHNGTLPISDETLYEWKGIERSDAPNTVPVFVEPGRVVRLRLGPFLVECRGTSQPVLGFSDRGVLSFQILDEDLLQVSAVLKGLDGRAIMRVVNNIVRVDRVRGLELKETPGHVRVTLPVQNDYVPKWMIAQARFHDPGFASDGRVVAFDIEVIGPGQAKVVGCWPDGEVGFVVTNERISLCRKKDSKPVSMVAHDPANRPLLIAEGRIDQTIFSFDERGRLRTPF
jgi:hypothetical protein